MVSRVVDTESTRGGIQAGRKGRFPIIWGLRKNRWKTKVCGDIIYEAMWSKERDCGSFIQNNDTVKGEKWTEARYIQKVRPTEHGECLEMGGEKQNARLAQGDVEDFV